MVCGTVQAPIVSLFVGQEDDMIRSHCRCSMPCRHLTQGCCAPHMSLSAECCGWCVCPKQTGGGGGVQSNGLF